MYGTNGHTYVRLDDSEINTNHDPQVDERLSFWKKMFEINIWSFTFKKIEVWPCYVTA